MGIASTLVPDAVRRRYALKFAIVLLVLGLSVAALAVVGTGEIAADVEDRVQDDQKALAEYEAQNVERWNERNFLFVERMATGVAESPSAGPVFEEAMEEEAGLHSVHHVDLEQEEVLTSTEDAIDEQSLTDVNEIWTAVPTAIALGGVDGGEQLFDTPVPGETHGGQNALFYGDFIDTDGDGAPDELVVGAFDMGAYADEMISPTGSVGYTVLDWELGDQQMVFDRAAEDGLITGNEHLTEDGTFVVMDEAGDSFFESYETAVNAGIDFATDIDDDEAAYYSGVEPGAELQRSASRDYQDDDFLVSVARVTEGSDFYVAMQTPESEGLVFVSTVRDWGLLLGGAGLLLVVLIGGVLGRNTSKAMSDLTTKAERMETGDLDVDLETDRIDSIGQLYDGLGSMRDSLSDQIKDARDARTEAERERERTQRLNEQLETDADHFRDVLQQYADGDLTVRMDPNSDHEVMNDIAAEFNDSVAEIESTVAELSRFADEVATASEQVTASSEEVRSASEQVSESVQQISDGAARQNETLQTVDREMEGLSTTVQQIAASSNQVADLAARTAETSLDGSDSAEAAMTSFERLEEERQSVVEEFERLREEVSQIDELTASIADIAEQTNMLALNANIEASRSESGDDGGFGVVASEVKELSEDAKTAADEIGERLERIQEQTERSAEEVDRTSDEFERVSEQVREAVEALDQIAEYAEETNTGVQEISAATEQQASATEQIVAMVDDAATISEETTNEAENVAAAAEEQTTAMTEVSNSASSLSQQSAQLSTALDRFDVGVEADIDITPTIDTETIDADTLPVGDDSADGVGDTVSTGNDSNGGAGENGTDATSAGGDTVTGVGNTDTAAGSDESDSDDQSLPDAISDLTAPDADSDVPADDSDTSTADDADSGGEDESEDSAETDEQTASSEDESDPAPEDVFTFGDDR